MLPLSGIVHALLAPDLIAGFLKTAPVIVQPARFPTLESVLWRGCAMFWVSLEVRDCVQELGKCESYAQILVELPYRTRVSQFIQKCKL